jgi:hypothetical protein
MSRTAHRQLINHHESVGNDAAASFQRAGYQGCRISPPDLAMASMAVVHAARPNFFCTTPGVAVDPIDRCDDGSLASLESAASPALFYTQSNIDQRFGNLETKLAQRHWRQQAIAGDRARSTPAYSGSTMISSPAKRIFAPSAQSHDWDVRATEVIAEARKMPLGQRRSDALGEAGRLRIAAEMKRWLSTK